MPKRITHPSTHRALKTLAARLGGLMLAALPPTASAQTELFYGGDYDWRSGVANGIDTEIPDALTFDDFEFPPGHDWVVQEAWGNQMMDFSTNGALVTIRRNVSAGNCGFLVYQQEHACTLTPTGRSYFFYDEYRVNVVGLNIELEGGVRYWVSVAPIGFSVGRSYVTTTSGTDEGPLLDPNPAPSGSPRANGNSFHSNQTGGCIPMEDVLGAGPWDFSYGVVAIPGCGQPVNITQHPAEQIVCPGGSATFSVTATGVPSPTYQWRKDGDTLIPGATGSSYTINSAADTDETIYECVVTNECGSQLSHYAYLTVGVRFTEQPGPGNVCEGQMKTFTVAANGVGPISYQWRKDGVNISGATGGSHTFGPITPADNGDVYDCLVIGNCAAALSTARTITLGASPTITLQPASASRCTGESVTFSVNATPMFLVHYQWRHAGSNIPGATSKNLTIASVSLSNAGGYQCLVTRTGSGCAVLSDPATLTVSDCGCQPCDTNCDGSINLFDIDPFVDQLSGSATGCSRCAGDANTDGSINLFDIDPFVECLTN